MHQDKSFEEFMENIRENFASQLEGVSGVMGHENASLGVTLNAMAQVYRSRTEKGLPGAIPETVVSDFIGLFSDLESRIAKIEQALSQMPEQE